MPIRDLDARRAWAKAYAARNRERNIAASRAWRLANPDRVTVQLHSQHRSRLHVVQHAKGRQDRRGVAAYCSGSRRSQHVVRVQIALPSECMITCSPQRGLFGSCEQKMYVRAEG